MTTQTIDMTPTWAGIMPAIIMALQHGTAEGQAMARAELNRLAKEVDAINLASRGEAAEILEPIEHRRFKFVNIDSPPTTQHRNAARASTLSKEGDMRLVWVLEAELFRLGVEVE